METKLIMIVNNISNGYLYSDDSLVSVTDEQKYFSTKPELLEHISKRLGSIGIIWGQWWNKWMTKKDGKKTDSNLTNN